MATPCRRHVARPRTRNGAQLIPLFRRRRTHDDFADEVQAHLDLKTDRLVAEGWSLESARQEAYKAFGNATLVKERFYESNRWVLVEQFGQDVRYAWRSLRHSPAFCDRGADIDDRPGACDGRVHRVQRVRPLRPVRGARADNLHQSAGDRKPPAAMASRWSDYLELRDCRDLSTAWSRRTLAS